MLVLAGEKMTHLSTSRTTRILAQVIERYERNCGASMPALAAMLSQRYMSRYRISLPHMQRALSAVAIWLAAPRHVRAVAGRVHRVQ